MPRRKRERKWLKWVFFLALVAIAGVVVWKVYDAYFKPKENVSPSASSAVSAGAGDAEKKSDSAAEAKTVEKVEDAASAEPAKKAEQYSGEDPNKSSELTGVITYAGVSGDKLMIRVNIDQYLSGGTCRLVLSRAGETAYEETVETLDLVSTSTCDGFDISTTSLAAPNYAITVYLSSGGKTGVITGEFAG